jgi:energy-coupling factor transporter ATP-binding protein EcfA2
MSPGAPHNPFSTGHHRAGVMAYRFEEGGSAAALFDRFLAGGAEGALIGPEGTGKSTLLAALAREAERRTLRVQRLTVEHDGSHPALAAPAAGEHLLCLDEADRLSWWRLHALRRRCRHEGIGLLVTAHRPLALPTLRRTSVSPALAVALAAQVLAQSPALPLLVRAEEAGDLLRAQGGDLRRVFLALYDRFEERHALTRKRFASVSG